MASGIIRGALAAAALSLTAGAAGAVEVYNLVLVGRVEAISVVLDSSFFGETTALSEAQGVALGDPFAFTLTWYEPAVDMFPDTPDWGVYEDAAVRFEAVAGAGAAGGVDDGTDAEISALVVRDDASFGDGPRDVFSFGADADFSGNAYSIRLEGGPGLWDSDALPHAAPDPSDFDLAELLISWRVETGEEAGDYEMGLRLLGLEAGEGYAFANDVPLEDVPPLPTPLPSAAALLLGALSGLAGAARLRRGGGRGLAQARRFL